MNKKRRIKISEIGKTLEDCACKIEDVLDEEKEAMENVPEGLQESERYSSMEQCVDLLSDALDGVQEASNRLTEVLEL